MICEPFYPSSSDLVLYELNCWGLQDIGKALLPTSTSKALPAPADKSSELATADSNAQTAVATPVTNADAVAPAVNSVPKAEIKEEPLPVPPRPLSPYPYVMSYFPSLLVFHFLC